MSLNHHTLLGRESSLRSVVEGPQGTPVTVLRISRLAELILGFYREERFEHVGGPTFMALTRSGDEQLRNVLPKEFWPHTVEFVHWQVRKWLIKAGKMRGEILHESMHLPAKFEKLSYQEVVDTLLWHVQYASDLERELIMEFLMTNGRCDWGYREFNEKNRRVQAILAQVGNSQVAQQFPKE